LKGKRRKVRRTSGQITMYRNARESFVFYGLLDDLKKVVSLVRLAGLDLKPQTKRVDAKDFLVNPQKYLERLKGKRRILPDG